MTRASPIKHNVHSHTREGHPVSHYVRGSGKHPTPRMPHSSPYRTLITYTSHTQKGYQYVSSYLSALESALNSATDIPKSITIWGSP